MRHLGASKRKKTRPWNARTAHNNARKQGSLLILPGATLPKRKAAEHTSLHLVNRKAEEPFFPLRHVIQHDHFASWFVVFGGVGWPSTSCSFAPKSQRAASRQRTPKEVLPALDMLENCVVLFLVYAEMSVRVCACVCAHLSANFTIHPKA